MKALLMNFGLGLRVIHDIDKMPKGIEVGKTLDIELDPVTARFIEKAQLTDTLMMIPLDGEMPKELTEIAGILREMDDVPYEEILTRTIMLIGKENVPKLRPTRPELRICLRDIAMQFAHGGAKSLEAAVQKITERRTIREDQDPGKLEQEQRDQADAERAKEVHPIKKATMRDRIDASLGLVAGPNEPAAQEASSDEPEEKAPEPKKSKKVKRTKAPAEFKPKRQAGPKPIPVKRAGSAGVQRVRA